MTLDDQLDHFAVNQRITSKSTVLVVGVKSMIKRKKNVKEEALHLPSSFRRYDVMITFYGKMVIFSRGDRKSVV